MGGWLDETMPYCGVSFGGGRSSRFGRGLGSGSRSLCRSRSFCRSGRLGGSRRFCGRFGSRGIRFGHRSGRGVVDASRRCLGRHRGSSRARGDSIACGGCAAWCTSRARTARTVSGVAYTRAAACLNAADLVTGGTAASIPAALAGLGGLRDSQRDERGNQKCAQGADERTSHVESPKGALGRSNIERPQSRMTNREGSAVSHWVNWVNDSVRAPIMVEAGPLVNSTERRPVRMVGASDRAASRPMPRGEHRAGGNTHCRGLPRALAARSSPSRAERRQGVTLSAVTPFQSSVRNG
jgi:hypothetical protein